MRCEDFVRDHLPSVKACIVNLLYREYGMNQTDIANALKVTQPAVSQYISGVRGCDVLPENICDVSKEVAHEIYTCHKEKKLGEAKLDELFCRICKQI